MRLIIKWLIITLSLFVAAWLIPGIHVEGNAFSVYVIMAVILGLVNSIVRPVIKLISLPITILTLGLYIFIINALMFWLASAIAVRWFNINFYVDGFWPAFLGSIVVSIVSFILSALLDEK
jgi:putative membrane protein